VPARERPAQMARLSGSGKKSSESRYSRARLTGTMGVLRNTGFKQ